MVTSCGQAETTDNNTAGETTAQTEPAETEPRLLDDLPDGIDLGAKYVNDEESSVMVDIITNNVYVDPAVLYLSIMNFNVMTLRDILGSGQNTSASRIASMQKQFQTNLDKINEAYGKLRSKKSEIREP